jgi:hypothetical protein
MKYKGTIVSYNNDFQVEFKVYNPQWEETLRYFPITNPNNLLYREGDIVMFSIDEENGVELLEVLPPITSPCQNHDLQMEDEEKYIEPKNKLYDFTLIKLEWNSINGFIFECLRLDFKINDIFYDITLFGIDTSFKTFLYVDILFKRFKIYDKTDY